MRLSLFIVLVGLVIAEHSQLNWMVQMNLNFKYAVDSDDNIVVVKDRIFGNNYSLPIWSYSGDDGSLLWNRSIINPPGYGECNTQSVQSFGERVVVITGECLTPLDSCTYNPRCLVRTIALNTTNGDIVWTFTGIGAIEAETQVDGMGSIYVAFCKPNNSNALQLHKLSGNDGSTIWTIDLPFPRPSYLLTSAISPNKQSLFYLSNVDLMLLVLNTTTGNIVFNYSLWKGPSYGKPYFMSDGTMMMIADSYLLCFNPDHSLRYWTTNLTVDGGEITFDERRQRAYVGFMDIIYDVESVPYYYQNWQAYDPFTGYQLWNFTYYVARSGVGYYFPTHAPLVRDSDGLLVYIEKGTFIGREFESGKVVFNITAPFTYPRQVSLPIMRKDKTAFYVSVAWYEQMAIWSVPLPPVTTHDPHNNPLITSEKRELKNSAYWQQCGSQCKGYFDCEGYTCSKCLNGICVAGTNGTCSYRGDCDERLFTCILGNCFTRKPECGGRCDYWAKCPLNGCATCSRRCQSI